MAGGGGNIAEILRKYTTSIKIYDEHIAEILRKYTTSIKALAKKVCLSRADFSRADFTVLLDRCLCKQYTYNIIRLKVIISF